MDKLEEVALKGSVAVILDELRHANELVSDNIGTLRGALAPILRAGSADIAPYATLDPEPECPLANEIKTIVEQVYEHAAFIADLHGRIQL